MRLYTQKIIIGFLFFYALSGHALAKQVAFEVTVDRNRVAVGEALALNLTFNGMQNIPPPDLGALDGFDARYLGPSTRLSIINGQASSSITHVYNLVALKKGSFKIGPLKFDYNGDTYTSGAITIEVVSGQGALPVPSHQPQAQPALSEDINDRAFVVVGLKRNKLYLNEIIPLTIKLYVNRLALRDIQYPEFNHEGFSVGQFAQPKQYQELINGVPFDVIEFNTSIFGVKPGEFRIGPSIIKCNLIVRRAGPGGFDDFFGDFFGRYDTHPLSLRSADIPVTVLAIPEDGRPGDYSGAVGSFELEASLSPQEVRAGDPVTLKMSVRGEGNFNSVNLPKISLGSDFKAYDPQVKQEKNEKIFEEIIIPLNENISEVPPISFSYFNTAEKKFQTLTKGPFAIRVVKPEKEEEVKVVDAGQGTGAAPKEEKIGRDIVYIKAQPGKFTPKGRYLFRNRLFLWLQLVPLFFYCLVVFFYHRLKKLKTDIQYARKLAAPGKAKAGLRKIKAHLLKQDTKGFYDAVFLTLQEYLGDRFHLPSQGITSSVVDEILQGKGFEAQVLDKLRDIFKECDLARFAPAQLGPEDMQRTLKHLEEAIDHLRRQKS